MLHAARAPPAMTAPLAGVRLSLASADASMDRGAPVRRRLEAGLGSNDYGSGDGDFLTCPNSTCTRAITVPWSIPPSGVARESSGPGGPLSYLFCWVAVLKPVSGCEPKWRPAPCVLWATGWAASTPHACDAHRVRF